MGREDLENPPLFQRTGEIFLSSGGNDKKLSLKRKTT